MSREISLQNESCTDIESGNIVLNTSWHSYPSIFAVGHKWVKDIFTNDVLCEEKIDGSQFSFGKFKDTSGNEYLRCRSKGCELNCELPEKMFAKAVSNIKEIFNDLHLGWTYRGEYLLQSKHNTLVYERVPNKNIIIFDININEEEYLSYTDKEAECKRLGLEIVPQIFYGKIDNPQTILSFLNRKSILGGSNIEGVVIKNYTQFGQDKKILMAKYVTEGFKEVHGGEWRKNNPQSEDILDTIVCKYRTPARWAKAVQHLRERGLITDSPKDIGVLIKESQEDIVKDSEADIKDMLYAWAKGKIMRGCVAGIAEWYKEELLKSSFNTEK